MLRPAVWLQFLFLCSLNLFHSLWQQKYVLTIKSWIGLIQISHIMWALDVPVGYASWLLNHKFREVERILHSRSRKFNQWTNSIIHFHWSNLLFDAKIVVCSFCVCLIYKYGTEVDWMSSFRKHFCNSSIKALSTPQMHNAQRMHKNKGNLSAMSFECQNVKMNWDAFYERAPIIIIRCSASIQVEWFHQFY